MDSIETDVPPSHAPPQVSGQMRPVETTEQQAPPSGLMTQVSKLWDVDTSDVKSRCLLALNPLLRTPYLTNGAVGATPGTIAYGKWPDMWGPVWILFTLVMVMFISITSLEIFTQRQAGDLFSSNWAAVWVSLFFMMLSFTFGLASGLWLLLQFFDLVPTLTLAQTASLYGYSNIIWIPAVIVTTLLNGLGALFGKSVVFFVASYLCALVGYLLSAWFVYGNIYRVIFQHASESVTVSRTKGNAVLSIGIFLHIVLAVSIHSFLAVAESVSK